MGSSCAVPDEKRGIPPGVYAHFTHAGARSEWVSDPGEKTSGRCFIAIESVRQRARGRGVGVGRARPALFLYLSRIPNRQ